MSVLKSYTNSKGVVCTFICLLQLSLILININKICYVKKQLNNIKGMSQKILYTQI